jgi:hypothetical protein
MLATFDSMLISLKICLISGLLSPGIQLPVPRLNPEVKIPGLTPQQIEKMALLLLHYWADDKILGVGAQERKRERTL